MKAFCLVTLLLMHLATPLYGVMLSDFENTGEDFGVTWEPGYHGYCVGVDADSVSYSLVEKRDGNSSAQLQWTWSGSEGFIRIQPASLIPLTNSDYSATAIFSFAVKSMNLGMSSTVYLYDTGYEKFSVPKPLSTDWISCSWNVLTDPMESYITGNGSLDLSACRFRGFMIYQGASSGAQTVWIDSIQMTSDYVGVNNWELY